MNRLENEDSKPQRIDIAHSAPLRFANLEIEPQRRIVRSGGAEILIEPRVMQALLVLARAGGAVVTREELVESCWDGRIVGDDSIHQVIAKIRKVGARLGTKIPVETIRGIGYRLELRHPIAEAQPGLPRPPRTRIGVLSVAFALGIALLASSSDFEVGAQAKEPVRLAILPFSDLSAGGGNDHVAQGVAEQILERLSEEPGLHVAGRSSAAVLGSGASFEEARERLGVSHLLEGSVGVQGGRLRMNVRLLRTSDGMQVWAERFDRNLGDVFAIQDEIGEAVASRLRGTLSSYPGPSERTIRTSSEVYDLYLKANQLSWNRNYEKLMEAQRLLRRAVSLDPSYAPAWAGLAINASIIDQFRPTGMYQDEAADEASAQQYAKRALALQPELAEAHIALAMSIERENPEAAVAAHQRAIELDPGSFLAWNNMGNVYRLLCRPKEALSSYRRAAAIEPLLFVPHMNLVDVLSDMGRYEEAEAEIDRYLSTSRNPLEAERLPGRLSYYRGDLSGAILHGRRARTLDAANPSIRTYLAFSLQATGRTSEAARILPVTQQQTLGSYWQGKYRAAAAQAAPNSDAFWDQGTRFFAVSKSLIRTGQPGRLLELFDSRFRSIEEIDREFRCALPPAALMPIVALRQVGRSVEAEQLLDKAIARFNESAVAGYAAAERDVIKAELLLLKGRRDQALKSLEQAVGRGWVNQSEPFIGLSDPIFDVVRDDPRFNAIKRQVSVEIAREQRELAASTLGI